MYKAKKVLNINIEDLFGKFVREHKLIVVEVMEGSSEKEKEICSEFHDRFCDNRCDASVEFNWLYLYAV